jgi:hypothetical protein
VDFDATGQLLIIYSALIKYFRKNENTMKYCLSYSRKPLYDSVIRKVLYNFLTEIGIPAT